MPTKRYFSVGIKSILILAIFFTTACKSASKTSQLEEFDITIERNGEKITMYCEEGCAWKKLSYQNQKQAQSINENGMIDQQAPSSKKNPRLADFLFAITKTENGLQFEGLEGTAWKALSFSLAEGKQQRINQYGMITD